MGFYADRVLPHIMDVVMNAERVREVRQRVCSGLRGDVVEIGFGTGHNLPFLPAGAERLRAVEPSQRSIALAAERIESSTIPVEIVGLDGQDLPLENESADAVLCTWSLCTISDPEAAVREMARVLGRGGELHFAEHGRAPEHGVRRWQDRLNGIQQRVGGGCHLDRDIPSIIEAAGLRITRLDTYYVEDAPRPYGFFYEGVAVAH